jgi:hypothetical protein
MRETACPSQIEGIYSRLDTSRSLLEKLAALFRLLQRCRGESGEVCGPIVARSGIAGQVLNHVATVLGLTRTRAYDTERPLVNTARKSRRKGLARADASGGRRWAG